MLKCELAEAVDDDDVYNNDDDDPNETCQFSFTNLIRGVRSSRSADEAIYTMHSV